jgi:hypothetical protein
MAAARVPVLLAVLVVAVIAWRQDKQDSFEERLRAEVPEAFDLSLSGFDRTSALRDWAYRNIDAAGTTVVGTGAYDTRNFEGQHPADIFARFVGDERGVFCGNAAITLRNLYRHLGFEAWSLDVGIPGELTHVTTLVWVDGMVVVQDAYFGGSFGPVDVRDVIAGIRAGEPPEWHEPELGPRDVLFTDAESRQGWQFDEAPVCERTAHGWVCSEPMDLADMERHPFTPGARTELAERGLDGDLLNLYLFPLAIYGGGEVLLDELLSAAQLDTADAPVATSRTRRTI